MDDEDLQRGEADRMLAAAIYLMSCHARNRCPRLAFMVGRHLQQLARHPGTGELVSQTCRQLAAAWETVRRHDERAIQTTRDVGQKLH